MQAFFISWSIFVSRHNSSFLFDADERDTTFFLCRLHRESLFCLSLRSDFEDNWSFWLARFIICRSSWRSWAWCWSLTWEFVSDLQRFRFALRSLIELTLIECRVQSDSRQTHCSNIFSLSRYVDVALDYSRAHCIAESVWKLQTCLIWHEAHKSLIAW